MNCPICGGSAYLGLLSMECAYANCSNYTPPVEEESSSPYPNKTYDILYIDPPWPYYGKTQKDAAAGKHYDLMTMEEIKAMPILPLCNKKTAVFVWATSPKMHYAIQAIEAWGLHFRGVAHVWVKTRKKDGGIIHGQGVPPTYSKPTTEFLLLATTMKKGRPLPLLDKKLPNVVLAPRGKHSEKPQIFRDLILQGYGDKSRLEMFARGVVPGWDVWGDEAVPESLTIGNQP